MLTVAIVEDDEKAAKTLTDFVETYASGANMLIRTLTYGDAETFLVGYREGADIVFMDIELPDMDGMSAAKKLRERDGMVMIVFVTNMAQYAIGGYAVGAFDFLVKPVTYYAFRTMMDRALPAIRQGKVPDMTVHTADGLRRVELSAVSSIEVFGHKLVYHTESGDIDSWGSLSQTEEKILPYGFARASNCCLVNMRHVTALNGSEIVAGGRRISISRTRRKEFVRTLNEYLGDR